MHMTKAIQLQPDNGHAPVFAPSASNLFVAVGQGLQQVRAMILDCLRKKKEK